MSTTLITIILAGVLLAGAFIIRWQRDAVIVRICPREILFLETVEERYRVHGRGLNAFMKRWRTWITSLAYVVAISVITMGISEVRPVIRVGPWSVTVVQLAVFVHLVNMCVLIPLLMLAHFRKWMRVYLRQYLNEHGIPICEKCGYDLRGQVNPRCPECGTEDGNAVERCGADDRSGVVD